MQLGRRQSRWLWREFSPKSWLPPPWFRVQTRGTASTSTCKDYAQDLEQLRLHAECGHVAKAELLAERLLAARDGGERTLQIESDICNSVVEACANADDALAAARWLDALAERRLDLSIVALGRMLRAVAEEGGTEAAEQWFVALDRWGPTAERARHRLVLHAWARRSSDVVATELRFLRLLGARVLAEDRLIATGVALAAVARSADPGRAAIWLARFDACGIDVSVTGLRAALRAQARLGDVDVAGALLERVREASGGLSKVAAAEGPAIAETAMLDCFNVVLRACAVAKRPRLAEEFFTQMRLSRVQPDRASHGAVLHALASAGGNTCRIEAWLGVMPREGVMPSFFEYQACLRACADVGDVLRAGQWLSRMGSACEIPDTYCYNFMIVAFARAGDPAAAEAQLAAMETNWDAPPDTSSYCSVAVAHSKAGDLASAERVLCLADDRCREAAAPRPHAAAFESLARRCARFGDIARAARLLDRMTEAGLRHTRAVLVDVLQACSPAYAGLAFRLVRQLEELLTNSAWVLPAHVYRAGARPFAELGDWRQVDKVLDLGAGASPEIAAELRLAALANVAAPQRWRVTWAVAQAVAAGVRVSSEDLRFAVGTPERRRGMSTANPAAACLSHARVTLDGSDEHRAQQWVRRWAASVVPRVPLLARSCQRGRRREARRTLV